MNVLIKFVDSEEIIIKQVTDYVGMTDVWKVTVNNECNVYFNKNQVKYIGDVIFLERSDI